MAGLARAKEVCREEHLLFERPEPSIYAAVCNEIQRACTEHVGAEAKKVAKFRTTSLTYGLFRTPYWSGGMLSMGPMLQHAIGSFELGVRSGRLALNHALDGEHVDAEFKKLKERLPAMQSDLLLHSLVHIVPLQMHKSKPNSVWGLEGLLVASMEIRTKFNIPYKISKAAIQRAVFLSVDKEGHVDVTRGVTQRDMSEHELNFLEGLPERVINFEHHHWKMRNKEINCYKHISKYRNSTEMTVLSIRKELDTVLEKLDRAVKENSGLYGRVETWSQRNRARLNFLEHFALGELMTHQLRPSYGQDNPDDEWQCLSYDAGGSRIGPLLNHPVHHVPHSTEWSDLASTICNQSEVTHFEPEFADAYAKHIVCVKSHFSPGVNKGDCPRILDQYHNYARKDTPATFGTFVVHPRSSAPGSYGALTGNYFDPPMLRRGIHDVLLIKAHTERPTRSLTTVSNPPLAVPMIPQAVTLGMANQSSDTLSNSETAPDMPDPVRWFKKSTGKGDLSQRMYTVYCWSMILKLKMQKNL